MRTLRRSTGAIVGSLGLVLAAGLLAAPGPATGPAAADQAGVFRTLDWESSADRQIPTRDWDFIRQSATSHGVGITSSPVRDGSHAARFELRRRDPVVNSGSRAELSQRDAQPAGAERWYGFSINLDESWAYDKSAEIVSQWHDCDAAACGGGSPPLALLTDEGRWKIDFQGDIVDLGPYAKGAWTDWVFHVKWRTGSGGLVEVWRNGEAVFRRVGATYDGGPRSPYFKFGIYKWDWSQGKPSSTTRRVLSYDALRLGDERAARADVDPARGAGPRPTGCVQDVPTSAAQATTEEAVNPAGQAIDGDLTTRWSGQGFGAGLVLDLGQARQVCGTAVAWHRGDLRWNDYTVYTSTDGTTFTKAWEGRSSGRTTAFETVTFPARTARYVRISFWQNPENDWASITEAKALAPGAPTPAGDGVTVVAVGDIAAICEGSDNCPQSKTAALVRSIDPELILTAGDNAYAHEDRAFERYFAPRWGQFKSRIRPSPGNHDYEDPGAASYFEYFGAAAKPDGKSWYSFDVEGWHIVSLNSEVERSAGSSQLKWLRADLAANTRPCVLAYWHRPKFSSGSGHGDFPNMKPFWNELFAAGADVVINGHDHDYERFAPQDPDGKPTKRGIRQFVVGTGGSVLRPFGDVSGNSEVRIAQQLGVLRLELDAGSYSWRFVTDGRRSDKGGPQSCH